MDTKYGDISPRTAAKAVKRLLKVGQALLTTERFGQVDPQPRKSSLTRKYRRYEPLPWATAPLAEGVAPAGQQLSATDIECSLEQYGDVVWLTDVIADTHEDPVFKVAYTRVGEQSAETVELIRINFLKAGTNVYYANNATGRATVNSPATRGDLRRIYRDFKRNRAAEISQIIGATARISTEPVAAAYFAMGSTDILADLKGLTGWVPVEQYSQHTKALPGEVGKVEEIRFILSPLWVPWLTSGASGTTYLSGGVAVTGAAQADVYPIVIVARDSYAIVPLQGKEAIHIAVQQPDKVDKSDPLGQRGFVSWKTYQTGTILQHLWVARLEVAATANPS